MEEQSNGLQHFKCLACGKSVPHERRVKLFCSDLCKEMAKYVRYYRTCKKEGRDKDPLVRDALKVRLFWILAGGYNQLQRKVPPETRERILHRDNKKCQLCGNEGNQIDHINGSSNDETNLQVLCSPCHMKKTLSSITVKDGKVSFSLTQSLVDLDLRFRIEHSEPVCPCDDENIWNAQWKSILNERREVHFQNVREYLGEKSFSSNLEVSKYLMKSGILTFSGKVGWSKEYVRELREHKPRANV